MAFIPVFYRISASFPHEFVNFEYFWAVEIRMLAVSFGFQKQLYPVDLKLFLVRFRGFVT